MNDTSFKDLPKPVQLHIQTLEKMRADFVANVSHELRTPLTVIMGYLEGLVDDKDLTGDTKDILSQMQAQSIRMKAIIDDLLLLSRIESEEVKPPESTFVDINTIIQASVGSANSLADKKRQTISVNSDAAVLIKGNADELQSLISNLLVNAIKYTDNQGSIQISWSRVHGRPTLVVQDNGIGIAPEHISRLTERFYRVDKGRSRDSGGTGLGLAIVKHILIRHSGQLNIESTEGVGSVFSCVFS